MILTLKELATYLRVNERTILRMQKAGQIQGIKVGGQWRFNGSQIDSLFFPGHPPTDPATAVPLNEFMSKDISVPISRLLREDRILLDLKGATGAEVIDEMVDVINRQSLCLDANILRRAIHARESLLSTGIGDGVAIPHPRDPVTDLREATTMIIGRSTKGVEFGAADGQPVHLFFLTASQTIQSHLNILGRLATLCLDQEALANLKQASSAEEFIRHVLKSERDHFIKSSPQN
ncbi:MAG: PTS sugar transporter subunit IIA [Lentisphaeria bacterium]|nr:PTS sugar transporter subunit IIA [Lentisphaeria bacterium]